MKDSSSELANQIMKAGGMSFQTWRRQSYMTSTNTG